MDDIEDFGNMADSFSKMMSDVKTFSELNNKLSKAIKNFSDLASKDVNKINQVLNTIALDKGTTLKNVISEFKKNNIENIKKSITAEKPLNENKIYNIISAKKVLLELLEKQNELQAIGLKLNKQEEIQINKINEIYKDVFEDSKLNEKFNAIVLSSNVEKKLLGSLKEISLKEIGSVSFSNIKSEFTSGLTKAIMDSRNISQAWRGTTSFIKTFSFDLKGLINSYTIILQLLIMAFDRWKSIDSAVENVRKQTGLIASQYTTMFNDIKSISKEFSNLGVTTEDVGLAIIAIGSEFNNNEVVIKDLVKNVTMMEKTFGITAQTSSKFFKNIMGITDGTTRSALKSELMLKSFSKLNGVAPKQVMEDIANASETTFIMTRGNVEQLIKGAVAARKMGLSIDSISKSMNDMLNFESSINDEMEASILLGKHVDFMNLRRISYSGSAQEYAEELNRTLKQFGNISEMNLYQQQAISKALGLSVTEMMSIQSMNKASADLEQRMGRTLTKQESDRLKKLSLMANFNSLSTEEIQKQIQLMGEQENIQQKQSQIANQLNKIWIELADVLVPIIDLFVKVLIPTLKIVSLSFQTFIMPAVNLIAGILEETFYPLFLKINELFKVFGYDLTKSGDLLSNWAIWIEDINKKAKMLGVIIKYINNLFAPIFSPITRTLFFYTSISKLIKEINPYIKWIIDHITTIISFITIIRSTITEILNLWEQSINDMFSLDWNWNRFVKGLMSIGTLLYSSLTYPFKLAYEWIMSLFGRNLPSEIGLRILDGILSIGKMVFDALTWPYRTAFDFILNFFIKFSNIVKKLLLNPFEGLKMIIDSIGNSTIGIGTIIKDILSFPNVESILSGIGGTISVVDSAESIVPDWLVPDFLFGGKENEGNDDKMDMVIELLTKLVEKESEMSVKVDGKEILKAVTNARLAQQT